MNTKLGNAVLGALGIIGTLVAGQVAAVPVVYEGSLTSGVTSGGFVNDPSLTGSPNDDFWSFAGTAGEVITLVVNRLNSDLDPAMELYLGVGADTAGLTHIAGADDNYPALPGFSGPFDDPFIRITLPEDGMYTVQVWDFASGPQIPGGFCYQVTLNREPTAQEFGCGTVPEPGSLALLGLALAGFGLNRRALKK